MISRFSENGEVYRKMMNTITGGFVYGIVIVIAITMLLHSKKSQKKVEALLYSLKEIDLFWRLIKIR